MNTFRNKKYLPEEDPREKNLTEEFVDTLNDNTAAGLHRWQFVRGRYGNPAYTDIDGRRLVLVSGEAEAEKQCFTLFSQEGFGDSCLLMSEVACAAHPSRLRDLYETVAESITFYSQDEVSAHMRDYLRRDRERRSLLGLADSVEQFQAAMSGKP